MLKVSQATIPLAAKILARGFFDDPMLSFIFLERENRLDALTAFFQVFLADTVRRGEVLIAPNEAGAIAWYPSDIRLFDDLLLTTTYLEKNVGQYYGGMPLLLKP